MVIRINEFIETPSNKMEELQIPNRNNFCFRFIIFVEEELNKEDSSRRNKEFFFSFNNNFFFRFNIYIYIYMVATVSSPSSFAVPLIIQKTPIVKLEFSKSKRTIIVKKMKFLYWLSHFPKEKIIFFYWLESI